MLHVRLWSAPTAVFCWMFAHFVNRQRVKTSFEKGLMIEYPGKTMRETGSFNNRPKRQEQIIVQKGSNDVLLFSMEDGSYYALNEVGNRIWELCDGTHEVAQLISILAKEYDAPVKIIEMDVMEVLEELQSKNLIVECGEDRMGFEGSGVSQGTQ
jgi:coenzyme PQQ synthesis protein D (PqqD)